MLHKTNTIKDDSSCRSRQLITSIASGKFKEFASATNFPFFGRNGERKGGEKMKLETLEKVTKVVAILTIIVSCLAFYHTVTLPVYQVMITNGHQAILVTDVWYVSSTSLHSGSDCYTKIAVRLWVKSYPWIRYYELADDEWLVIGGVPQYPVPYDRIGP